MAKGTAYMILALDTVLATLITLEYMTEGQFLKVKIVVAVGLVLLALQRGAFSGGSI